MTEATRGPARDPWRPLVLMKATTKPAVAISVPSALHFSPCRLVEVKADSLLLDTRNAGLRRNNQPGNPMLFRSKPAVSQPDPHDAIVAQLRELAPRIKQDRSEIQETSSTAQTAQPVAEPLFEAAPSNDNAEALLRTIPPARPRRGVLLKVLLAICAGVAAAMVWHSYGEQAKQRLSELMPQLLTEAPASSANADGAEAQDTAAQVAAPQPDSEAEPAQTAVADTPQPSTPSMDAVTPPTQAPAAQAAPPDETAQKLEAMATDIATLKQTVEELRTSEQQLRREMAAEREARAKPVQHAAKPTPPRRQRTSPQAAAAPYTPPASHASPPPATERRIYPQESMQRDAAVPPAPAPARLPPQPGDDSAPRPPMPLR